MFNFSRETISSLESQIILCKSELGDYSKRNEELKEEICRYNENPPAQTPIQPAVDPIVKR